MSEAGLTEQPRPSALRVSPETHANDARDSALPTVSVIMPVRDESDYIETALGAVLAQDYPAELLQILVVDGRSTDNTRALVQAMAEQHPNHSVSIIDNPGKIAPCALNAGLANATAEIVVRVDGHCEIGPEYVRNGVAHLQSDAAEGVGGILETIGETPQANSIAVAMSSRFGVGGSAFRTSDASAPARLVDTVAFPAYRKSVLDAAGPFDEELVRNQDDEYNYRLRKAGHRILLVPDMPVRYSSRARLGALFKQYYQYGYWKVRVLQKHPKQMSLRQFVPPAFVAGLIGSPLLALVFAGYLGRLTPWLALAPVLAYTPLNLAMALTEGAKRRVAIATLAASFALIHLGYGAGFLVGMLRFAARWKS